jgi:putative ABC transport system permease protein
MNVLRDLRYGVRVLTRNPGFALAALGVLALGVGASTVVFSVLRAVLLAPLPYRDASRLVLVRADAPGVDHEPWLTPAEYFALRDRSDLFDGIALFNTSPADFTDADVMAPASGALVSDNFFSTLGVGLLFGRSVDAGDLKSGAVDLGYDAWQQYFGGDPHIIGRTIGVNNRPVRVVGVLPRDFRLYLGPGLTLPPRVDIWFPRSIHYLDDPARDNNVIARLGDNVSLASARAAVAVISNRLVSEHPSSYAGGPVRLSIAPVTDDVVRDVRPSLLAIAGAVGFVLLVACANLMNLLLARASARTRELAVRVAIGASRGQIVRQLTTEGMLIGALGAGGGLLLASWAVDLMVNFAPSALPRRETIHLDATVVAFAIVISVVCAVAVSMLPAWHATRRPVSRTMTREGAATPRATAVRGVLVSAQIALSLMLLVGAGLMARAFVSLRAVPLGFDPQGVVTAGVSLNSDRFHDASLTDTRAHVLAFYQRLADALRQLPAAEAAGVGGTAPLANRGILQQGYALGPGETPRQAEGIIALAGYLETLRVPLVAGRYFTRADDDRAAVIVDEQLAARLWPRQLAVGRRLLMLHTVGDPQWAEVVGVARHIQNQELRRRGLPQIWVTYAIRPYPQLNLAVRSSNPASLLPAIKDAVQRAGAGRPLHDVRLLDDSVADASADTRFALFVLGVFAAVALLLTAIGVYGVVAYATARRTREIAVRLALGADSRGIVALVVREGAGWTLAGIAAGVAGAFVLSNYLRVLLFQVGARDPLTFALVAALLALVSLAATAIPALRAVRVDPMLALRAD